jgi:methylmalonyl-CoA/ethylmalonyl-CoA epimerase
MRREARDQQPAEPLQHRPEAEAVNVTRIDQIAIAVEDLDETLAFYERAFGLTPEYRERVESDGVEEAMLNVGGVYIQLLQATRNDSPIAKYLAKNGPGLHHVGFGVSSVGGALDHLRSEGVRLIDEQPRPGGGGHTVAFVHPKGTGGVLVELVEDADH